VQPYSWWVLKKNASYTSNPASLGFTNWPVTSRKNEEKKKKGRKEKKRFVLIIRQFILKGNSYRFQMIFTKSDECHFVVGVGLFCHISSSTIAL